MHHEMESVLERLGQLEQRGARSEAQCAQLEEKHEAVSAKYRRLSARLRLACGLGLASLMVALFASPATRAAAQSGYGATLQSLINKTQYLTVENGQMYIHGTNLWIQNGTGATNGDLSHPYDANISLPNGLGNLIVGYNESRVPFGGTDERLGSHNLVIGQGNNYTKHGGQVVGAFNTITGNFGSVSGGLNHNLGGFWFWQGGSLSAGP